MLRKKRDELIVEGVILLDSYDSDGSVLSVNLKTDRELILIFDNMIGERLIRSIGKKIWAKGTLWREPEFQFFEIQEFRFLD